MIIICLRTCLASALLILKALQDTNHKNSLVVKECTEGANIVSIGGVRQLWLPEQQRTVGFKVGYDDIRHHGGGLGLVF